MNMRTSVKKLSMLILTLLLMFSSTSLTALECFLEKSKNLKDTVFISINFESARQLTDTFENAFIKINFDDEKLRYQDHVCSGILGKHDIKIEKSENSVTARLNPNKNFDICSLNSVIKFKLKAVNISECQTSLEVKYVNSKSNHEYTLLNKSINLEKTSEIENCKLSGLRSNFGKLNPDFNPNIFEYEMEVEHDVGKVSFEALKMSDDLEVKVNSQKLDSPGKTTDITIKVSNRKIKKFSKEYVIHVHRKNKPEKLTTLKAKLSKTENIKIDKLSPMLNAHIHCEKVKSKNSGKNIKGRTSKTKSGKHHKKSKSKENSSNSQENFEEIEEADEDFDENDDETEKETSEKIEIPEKDETDKFKIYLIITFIVTLLIIISILTKNIVLNKKSKKTTPFANKK